MTSATFRLGKSSVSASGPWTWSDYDEPIDVSASDYVKAEFESIAGIDTAAFSISSADEVVLAAGAPTVTVEASTRTATFQVGASAATYIVRATANPNTANALTKELAVHVPTATGHRLMALDETDQSSRSYYWLAKVNDVIRYGSSLPSGSTNQFLTYSSGWIATNDVVLPTDGNRAVYVATPASGAGFDLTISPGAGFEAAGDDDGHLYLKDGSGNTVVDVFSTVNGGDPMLGFFGAAAVGKQTLDYFASDDSLAQTILDYLVLIGLVNKNLLVA